LYIQLEIHKVSSARSIGKLEIQESGQEPSVAGCVAGRDRMIRVLGRSSKLSGWRRWVREWGNAEEVLPIFVDGGFQAVLAFFSPAMKMTPAITSLNCSDPFNDRQILDALSISL
jgi:hypothetical protein